MRIGTVLLTALGALAATSAWADDTAQRFGARENVQQASISPDGQRVAIIRTLKGRGAALFIGGVDVAPKAILSSDGDPERLSWCRWSTDIRLICGIYVVARATRGPAGFSRLVTLNADGSDVKQLSARETGRALGRVYDGGGVVDWSGDATGGAVLVTSRFVPEDTAGTILSSQRDGLGVERVDTTSLKRVLVEAPRTTAAEYISDGHGAVRVMGLRPTSNAGYLESRIDYLYRQKGDRAWRPLSSVVLSGEGRSTGFEPYAVDRDLNMAYGFDGKDGRSALYRVALDESLKRELVVERPDVDIDSLVSIGRNSRIVGVSYATDKRRIDFFDPKLKALAASLAKALPNLPLISFVDASADENTLLLFAGSDVDPGRYYLYDRTTRKLGELLPIRPELAGNRLATVTPISFKSADGTAIPGYLTLPAGSSGKGLPAIVMPHGGPGARDEWGFDWLAQFFAARGYAVLQPNFRGSTGYGEAWFQKNGFQSWRIAVGDVNDGGRWLLSEGIAAPGKIAIVGWSYGGYAALQSAVLDPDLFKAIVAIAPVTDLAMLRESARGYTNFRLVDAFIGQGPHVKQGSPAQNADRIKAPVLMFHGDLDLNVGVAHSRNMHSRLKDRGQKAEYIEYPELDHQLDDDTARTDLLTRSDDFLRTSLGL